MAITVVPFADEHIEPACQLLAARHCRMAEQDPLLTGDFSNPHCWVELINDARAKPLAGGLAAIADQDYAGHLLWRYVETPPESIFSAFFPVRGVEATLDGFAVDPARPEAARGLYAAASQQWIDDGRGTHVLPIPAAELPVLDALYGLGFGRSLSLAVRESGASEAVTHQSGIAFREASPGDEDTVRRLAEDLWRSYSGPPIYCPFIPEAMADLYAHADRYISDPTTPVWLAERNGRAEALEVFLTPESSDWFLGQPLTPPGVIYLFWASTAPEARGAGMHTALLGHTSRWAQDQGYSRLALHFLAASFASEYWQRQGFRPLAHWLKRTIDPRALPSS